MPNNTFLSTDKTFLCQRSTQAIPGLWLPFALSLIGLILSTRGIVKMEWTSGGLIALLSFWTILSYQLGYASQPSKISVDHKKACQYAAMAVLTSFPAPILIYQMISQFQLVLADVAQAAFDLFPYGQPLIQSAMTILGFAQIWLSVAVPLVVGSIWYGRMFAPGKCGMILTAGLLGPMSVALLLRSAAPFSLTETVAWVGTLAPFIYLGYVVVFGLALYLSVRALPQTASEKKGAADGLSDSELLST